MEMIMFFLSEYQKTSFETFHENMTQKKGNICNFLIRNLSDTQLIILVKNENGTANSLALFCLCHFS